MYKLMNAPGISVSCLADLTDAKFAVTPLPQQLSRSIPYGSAWVIETKGPNGALWSNYALQAPTISASTTIDFNAVTGVGFSEQDFTQEMAFFDSPQKKYISGGLLTFPKSLLGFGSQDSMLCAYIDACTDHNELLFWGMRGCSKAELKITHWDYDLGLQSDPWDTFDASIMAGSNSRYLKVKSDLQDWFGVSVDELAALLDLSPTTVVNLTKPGRVVRPKTVRKMMIVYGLLSEFQRVMGQQTALTWARTVGYRLLSDGDLQEFEQFISTHIFPTLERKPRGESAFGSDAAELSMKPSAAIGRPSRI